MSGLEHVIHSCVIVAIAYVVMLYGLIQSPSTAETRSSPKKISMQNITKWDSLNHIGLISAIEENFDINFKDDEIIDMINYDSIIKKIKKYKKNDE